MKTAYRRMVEIYVEIRGRAARAVLVSDGVSEVWLPTSLIDIDPARANKYSQTSITMPEWLAKEKGLI